MACRLCLDGYDIEEDACRKGQAELLAFSVAHALPLRHGPA